MTGTAKEAWDSIQMEWGKSTNMRRSHAQEALNQTTYAEGGDIQDHIKLLQTWKAAVNSLSMSAMNDETWRGIIIQSIPPTPRWLLVILSLYTMSSSADIVSTLLAHGMIIGRDPNNKPSAGTNHSETVLVAKTNDACTNPNCKAKKRSTHITNNCYWPGGGKEGQFPANFGQRNRANVANTLPTTDHFVLSAHILDTPGQSGVLIDILIYQSSMVLISQGFQTFQKGKVHTFMDSRASDTMFISRDLFIDYRLITPRLGNSAKAKNSNFEIVGEGNVTQCYQVNGKEHNITFTHALHTPTLNANLISVSSLDKAGLTTIFEREWPRMQMALLSCWVKKLMECICWKQSIPHQTCHS